MGLVNRAITHQRTRPAEAAVGGWLDATASELPFLLRDEILGVAGLRAILGADTADATSTYLEQGRHSGAARAMASDRSLLRARAVNDTELRVDCGVVSPTCTFPSDWLFRCSAPRGGAGSIEMISWRTRDNALVNNDILKAAREATASTLATGAILTVADGVPQTSTLAEVATARVWLAGEKDHLDRLPDEVERPLRLTDDAAVKVATMLADGYHHPRQQPDGGWRADLAGGRDGDTGSVTLRRGDSGWELVTSVPATLTPLERQRSYRAALMCLRDLALRARDNDAALADSITAHMSRITAATTRPDRLTTTWVPARDAETAGPFIDIVADRWYPIGVRIVTERDFNTYSAMIDAQEWVALRKRTVTSGWRAKTREERRVFTARRPAALVDSQGNRQPQLRYVAQPDARDEVLTSATYDAPWFWEVRPRKIEAASGVEPGGLLMVTGWSKSGDELAYGEELFALMHAFASVVTSRDPQARIQTVYVAT